MNTRERMRLACKELSPRHDKRVGRASTLLTQIHFRTIWALLVAAAATAPAQGQTLTLDEAIRIAEANAFAVKLAESNVEKTRQRIAEVRAGQGPRVDLNTTYTRFDRVSQSGGFVFSPIDQTVAQVVLSMPLDITGIVARGIRATEVALLAARELVGNELNYLRERVRQDYYRVLQAEALVRVAAEALANSRERLEVTRKEVEAGTKARVDLIRIETQVRQHEADLLAAQNGVRLSKQALNNTMGRPIQTEFEPVDIVQLPKVEDTADELVQKAHANRPDVRAQEFNIRSLALVTKAREGGLYPSLNLSAVHQRNIGDIGFGGRRESTTGQLTLSVPIFDSGVTRAQVRQARQDEEQAKILLEQLKLGVSLEVRQALSNLSDAWARYEVAQKAVELATETYRLAKIRYDAGEGIQLEVVDAQTELTRAQSQLVAARYEYLSAYAALQRAVAADDPDATPASGGSK